MDKKDITEKIKENNINWVQVHFTDIMGMMRVVHFPSSEFIENVMDAGFGFDGSSVGFTNVESSDLIGMPDKDTFLILPHTKSSARVIADIYSISGKPFPADPRNILKKAVKKARRMGFDKIMISPEMEFYVIKDDGGGEYKIEEKSGYFIPPPMDDAKEYRDELASMIMKSGYNVKYHHHETGINQHEVEVKTLSAIDAADFCIYFKYLAREIASRYGYKVTFMPKPFSNDAGNGMHAHIVLYSGKKNIFYDENDEYRLSKTARYFIGGILKHSRSIAAIANPTINSYKRLIPNFEAPCYIAWGRFNRSSLIRIPAKKNIDIEVRNPDGSANPYLLYASLIYAGLDGIKRKIEYEAIEENLYTMDERELTKRGINKMPSSLMEAIEELENDTFMIRAMGKEAMEIYIERKKEEWRRYMREITPLDYKFYFNS